MKLFPESSVYVQVLYLFSLLVLFILQLHLENLCYNNKEKGKLIFNGIPLIAAVLLTVALMWHRNRLNRLSFTFTLVAAAALILLLYVYTGASIAWQKRAHRDQLTAGSVKEACNNLPFGLCFFAQNELPVLCNVQMSRITEELIGKNMQSLGELERALLYPADGVTQLMIEGKKYYRFSDGNEWLFEKAEVTDDEGNRYFQVTAANHTELNRLNAECRTRNLELKKMMKRLDRIRANMADSVREQEILTAKMRLHNKMGGCMTAARQYYMQNLTDESAEKNPGQKAELLKVWSKTVSDLEEEIGQNDEGTQLEELTGIAKNAGLEIIIHGQLPADPGVNGLFMMALRECMINAIHHAAAGRLDLGLTRQDETVKGAGGTVTGVFTNDGRAPEGEITEGGGLTGLRGRIEAAGGTVTVRSLPVFSLTVTLPEKLKNEEEEDDDECPDCGG